jgi:hypothetical protein
MYPILINPGFLSEATDHPSSLEAFWLSIDIELDLGNPVTFNQYRSQWYYSYLPGIVLS